MRLALVLLSMLMVVSAAFAAPVTKTTGPYKVSFDLNTTYNYSVQVAKPYGAQDSSNYLIEIKRYNVTMASLTVLDYKNLSDSTLATGKTIYELETISRGYYNNVSGYYLKIDGKVGFLVAGSSPQGFRLYSAHYWLDSKNCECGPVSVGTSEVGVISLCPINVTKNLVTSIHIEKTNSAEMPKTLVFTPPKSK